MAERLPSPPDGTPFSRSLDQTRQAAVSTPKTTHGRVARARALGQCQPRLRLTTLPLILHEVAERSISIRSAEMRPSCGWHCTP